MEKQNCLRGIATSKTSGLKAALPLLLLAGGISANAGAVENDARVEELKRRLVERETEVAALKAELARLQSPASAGPKAGSSEAGSAAKASSSAGNGDDDELDRALESSLVRQGGGVLRSGTIELEPEFSYFYDEISGRRRDNSGLALTGRVGLHGAIQAELRIPYVVRDHWSGVGTSSGLGDIRLGLTKVVYAGTERSPALFAFGQWRTATGDINDNPPTGYGQHALQLGLSTVKRQDPVVLFGSVFYNANLGSAHLNNGARLRAGNVFGGRLGSYLAATPDTSFYLGVAFNSNGADRLNGNPINGSSRLNSMVELGTTTVIGPGRFLNVSAGFGVTPAAPKFSLAVSLPFRF